MAWVTPPTFTVNEQLSSADLNKISGDLAVLETFGPLYAVGGALVGSSPTLGQPSALFQTGVQTISFTSGLGALVFPAAFPSGVLTLQVCAYGGSATEFCSVSDAGGNVGGFSVWYSAAGSAFTGSADVTFLAIGY